MVVQQRVLTHYRAPLFKELARSLTIQVLCGEPLEQEGIATSPQGPGSARITNRYVRGGDHHYLLCWQSGAIRSVLAADPDVVLFEANPRLVSNLVLLAWCGARRRRAIGWGLGELERTRGRVRAVAHDAIMRLYVRRFDEMLAYSSGGAEHYRRMRARAVTVAPNAVDDRRHRELRASPDVASRRCAWRQRWSIPADSVVILSVGRLAAGKSIPRLIEAVSCLGGPAHLVVVGDGPLRPSLEMAARVSESPATFTGALFGDELATAFAASDIFVMPGLGGLALYEAVASGLPVIVSRGDGTENELVVPGLNGFVVSPDDDLDLITCLQQLTNDKDLRSRFAAGSVELAADRSFDSLVQVVRTSITREQWP